VTKKKLLLYLVIVAFLIGSFIFVFVHRDRLNFYVQNKYDILNLTDQACKDRDA